MKPAALVAGFGLALSGMRALAVPVTFGFTGTVTQVTDSQGVLAGGVAPQDGFSGQFRFNSDAIDANPDPEYGSYSGDDFLMRMQVGAISFDSSAGTEHLSTDKNARSGDSLTFFSGAFDAGRFYVQECGVYFLDSTYPIFNGTALPLVPPPLSAFRYNWLSLVGTNGVNVAGTVSSLFLVPEPTTCILFGLLGLWGLRRPCTSF